MVVIVIIIIIIIIIVTKHVNITRSTLCTVTLIAQRLCVSAL
jgi:hypothetical protein